MRLDNEALVRDLVAWVAQAPRPYRDVMSAWRTSCPRLTIWEDAVEAGLVRRDGATVEATPLGHEFLARHRGPDATERPTHARRPVSVG